MCTECVGGCPKDCITISNERPKTGAKEYIKNVAPAAPAAPK